MITDTNGYHLCQLSGVGTTGYTFRNVRQHAKALGGNMNAEFSIFGKRKMDDGEKSKSIPAFIGEIKNTRKRRAVHALTKYRR